MASSVDPFPAVSKDEAKRLLGRWFGNAAVRWEQPFGPVFIQIRSGTGAVHIRRFTWQQAKYLAIRPTAREALIAGHYPVDWPGE